MKKKTLLSTLIGLFFLGYLIYQIWDVTQASKKNSEFKPNYLRGFIRHSDVLSMLDSATAYSIVNCYYDKFINKYGKEKLIECDNKYLAGDTSVYRIFAKPIIDSCSLPYKQRITEARNMNDCIKSFSSNKRTQAQKKAFCNCLMEKEKLKFGDNFADSVKGDSVLRREILESGCAAELNK